MPACLLGIGMADRGELEKAARSVQPLATSGTLWRQTAPRHRLASVPPIGRGGRYDRVGGPPVLYLSDRPEGAWAELFRHQSGPTEVAIHLVRRRIGTVTATNLELLDVTAPHIRATLNIVDDDLVSDDYQLCWDLADAARAAGFDGLRAPAGAMAGPSTTVVFDHAAPKIVADGDGKVGTPPWSVARDLADIRFRYAKTYRSAVAVLPFHWRLRAAVSVLRRR